MKKQFLNALLCGAVAFSATGTFTSCSNDDDIDELKSRITVVEGKIAEIKTLLEKALTTGASITNVTKDEDGAYTLTLSDGSKIELGSGSGSNIKVVVTDTEATITIDGKAYTLPLGSLVNSLIYSPESVAGIVELGNDGATVNFLARPALKSLEGAEFSIAESHVLTRAADGEQFKVSGEVKLDGDFIKVPIKALGEAEAGKTYAVSLQLNLKGAVIGSNYFNVKIADDFSSVAEDLGGVEIKGDYAPKTLADGSMEMTIKGGDLLTVSNFKDLLSTLPDKAEFVIAGQSKQPEGQAREKYEMLKKSLAKDGTWGFSERPGTAFNDNTERPGFLFNVVANDVVKAKIYVIINDELAGVDFTGGLKGLGDQHMEYGEPTEDGSEGEGIIVNPGANKIDLTKIFMEGKLSLKHGKANEFLAAFKEYSVGLGDESLVYSDGTKLLVGDLAKKYLKNSRGIRWYNAQTSIGKSQRRNWNMTDEEKQAFAGSDCNGELLGVWDGLSAEDMVAKGLNITEDGFLETTEAYGGWNIRVGMKVEFQYEYGSKPISDGCAAFLWINRRKCAEGVVDLKNEK